MGGVMVSGRGRAVGGYMVCRSTWQRQDEGGRAGDAGNVDEAAVARVLAHPFFSQPPPKSLDRNAFRHWVTEEGRLVGKSTPDGAATLTAITAAAGAHAITVLPRPPAGWVVARRRTGPPHLVGLLCPRPSPAP